MFHSLSLLCVRVIEEVELCFSVLLCNMHSVFNKSMFLIHRRRVLFFSTTVQMKFPSHCYHLFGHKSECFLIIKKCSHITKVKMFFFFFFSRWTLQCKHTKQSMKKIYFLFFKTIFFTSNSFHFFLFSLGQEKRASDRNAISTLLFMSKLYSYWHDLAVAEGSYVVELMMRVLIYGRRNRRNYMGTLVGDFWSSSTLCLIPGHF